MAEVLKTLLADPGRPRLTWYGDDGERVELSGHVLVNWVVKTTNLLTEELDAGPGTRVRIDLPPHWRTLVWATATWRAGACAVIGDHAVTEPDDAVVTTDAARWATTGADVVAVALPALARSYGAALPPGAIDAASAVMTYADTLGPLAPVDGSGPALDHPAGHVSHAGLLDWARTTVGEVDDTERPRLLLSAEVGVTEVLAVALDVWSRDGSLVLCSPETASALGADADRRARLVASERVTG
ncbi:MAG: TIGR03089 family protein [Cellulomonadaceae bacterium]|nr:TIGR03089 family protein [Cellulomonadaceae bacterium]